MLTADSVCPAIHGGGLSHRHEQKQNCDEDGQQFPCTFPDDVTGGDHGFVRHPVLSSRTMRNSCMHRLDLDQSTPIASPWRGGGQIAPPAHRDKVSLSPETAEGQAQ